MFIDIMSYISNDVNNTSAGVFLIAAVRDIKGIKRFLCALSVIV
jgi:hypothetical protein